MNYHILKEYNFTDPEIELFQILIEQGESTVSKILEHTSLSRTSVHDGLNSLLARDFLEYRKEGRNAYYKAVHPNKLYALLEEKKQATARLNAEMEEVIRGMVGSYNLSESKPGVRFFEGEDAIRTTAFDSLQDNTDEILTIHNLSIVSKYYNDLNEEYVRERLRRNIPSKVLTIDTAESRAYQASHPEDALTQIRLTRLGDGFEQGVLKIYGTTVSILTIHDTHPIGILIEHPHIASLHRALFMQLWSYAGPKSLSE